MDVKDIISMKLALRKYFNFYKSVQNTPVEKLSISDLTLLKLVSTSSITTALKKHSKLEILQEVKTKKTKVCASDIARNYLSTCSDEEFEQVTGVKRKH